jgi:hypothetical protein
MQNLPDKGVSGSSCYLLAECTATGITRSLLESQGQNERKRQAFPDLTRLFWGPFEHLKALTTKDMKVHKGSRHGSR